MSAENFNPDLFTGNEKLIQNALKNKNMKAFIVLEDLHPIPALEGATLAKVDTAQLTIAYTTLRPGTVIPIHQHPEEAVDILLEGKLEMQVGEQVSSMVPGMISIVPSNIPHTARAVTNCKVVTIFYPRRS